MSNIKSTLIGNTVKFTWIDSSVSLADSADFTIYSGSETIVNTGTLTSSGNGHYYANFTIPNSYDYGYYVAETLINVGGLPYKKRLNFKIVPEEVD